MISLISLCVVIILSTVMVRVGAIALEMTGLSRDSSVFQAHSAFSGVGFTTSESEAVVNHPVRRRILRLLMLLGNVGFTSVIATLVLSLSTATQTQFAARLVILASVVVGLLALSRSRWLDRGLNRLIRLALARWTTLSVVDYAELLGISRGYVVSELEADENDWIAERSLADLALSDEGIVVLGVQRKGRSYLGAPRGGTVIKPGDMVTLYGPEALLRALAEREAGEDGDRAHKEAVAAEAARRTDQPE